MTKSYKRLEKYLFDRSKILLSRSTAVKSLIKLSTSKHCTNGWNDICNQNSKSISQLINMVFQSNSTQILNEVRGKNLIYNHTSAWGSPSSGGTSTERRQFSIENMTRSFPGEGMGTLETIYAMTSHKGLLGW